MKTRNYLTAVAFVLATALAGLAQQATTTPSGGRSGGGGGGMAGGYSSGGEPGSVVQIMRDAEVQAELRLTDEQKPRVNGVLKRVEAMERQLFDDSIEHQQSQTRDFEAATEQRNRQYLEAHQQLAQATERILALLTPAQRAQLQAICRQSAAAPTTFQGATRSFGSSGGAAAGGGGRGGVSGGSFSTGGGTTRGGTSSNVPGPGRLTQNYYESGGGPGSAVQVISHENVQARLGLSLTQRQQITAITSQVQQFEAGFQARASEPLARSDRSWYQQRKEKEDATRQAVQASGEEILRMLEPAQQKRLKEICLQAQGADALFKPEIIQALGITATQQIRFSNLKQEAERQISGLFFPRRERGQPRPPMDLQVFAARRQAIQRDIEQRMLTTVLTPTQQAKLHAMKGNEFAGVERFRASGASGASGGGGGGSTSKSQGPGAGP